MLQAFNLRMTIRLAACLLLLATAFAGTARAHPHIWVHVHTTVLYENGAISGFRHAWTFDEYYTVMAVEGLDTDKDGKYSREELAELAKVNIDGLKEFAYFTYPQLGTEELSVTAPKDFWLEHGPKPKSPDDEPAKPTNPNAEVLPRLSGADRVTADAARPTGVLTLHFTLPLAKPVLADAEGFGFTIQDPSFFIAFEPLPGTPVVLGPGAPKGCRIVAPAPAMSAPEPSAKPGDLIAPQSGQPGDPTVRVVSNPGYKIECKAAG